uniref:Reverse transcriptase domain-containing protein n=1 Tax=Arundo donax TaxID=35708 RepID=A0A0A9AEQ4_ARUDO
MKKHLSSITKDSKKQVLFNDYIQPDQHYQIDADKLEKLISKGVMGYVLQIRLIPQPSAQQPPGADVTDILDKFAEVFKEPTDLPPKRTCDQAIPLKEGSVPPNIRPYRMPHHQKDEVEKLVKQMLDQSIIQVSESLYSSPRLLVRKKDSSCFCVDYRFLNDQTIKHKFPIPLIEDFFDVLHAAKYFFQFGSQIWLSPNRGKNRRCS